MEAIAGYMKAYEINKNMVRNREGRAERTNRDSWSHLDEIEAAIKKSCFTVWFLWEQTVLIVIYACTWCFVSKII